MRKRKNRRDLVGFTEDQCQDMERFLKRHDLPQSVLETFLDLPSCSLSQAKKGKSVLTRSQWDFCIRLFDKDTEEKDILEAIDALIQMRDEARVERSDSRSGETVPVTAADMDALSYLLNKYGSAYSIPRKHGISVQTYLRMQAAEGEYYMREGVLEKLRTAAEAEKAEDKAKLSSDDQKALTGLQKLLEGPSPAVQDSVWKPKNFSEAME
ncbi:MAG: hypothetical protein J6Y62_01520, partial [Clostridia bacterium]|nr:hypothetical protein [Clostridia bacterium]